MTTHIEARDALVKRLSRGGQSIQDLKSGALAASHELARTCEWTAGDEYWSTACGEAHTFIDSGPVENNHHFCPYCGGRINVKEAA